jgi:hypothetical protein
MHKLSQIALFLRIMQIEQHTYGREYKIFECKAGPACICKYTHRIFNQPVFYNNKPNQPCYGLLEEKYQTGTADFIPGDE